MKLYYIWQTINNLYDTYDSAVVAAENEVEARHMHPSGKFSAWWGDWAEPENVNVMYIGEAADDEKFGPEQRVICASFNAG